ncbi:MAG TPA: DinB family protein, partial [Ferruginibacter sp.]|nr:DinB family protein [Ferruginibacter sp.]
MITEISDKKEILAAIDEAISGLTGLMSPLDENKVNTIPYKDSWTAGQLFNHVTKSINGMAKSMVKESAPAGRDPGERIAGLRKAFLGFSSKMKSPDFIIPGKGPYEKQAAIDELRSSFELLKENTNKANLNELLQGLPLGEITKLELLHFVLYHTQRHL